MVLVTNNYSISLQKHTTSRIAIVMNNSQNTSLDWFPVLCTKSKSHMITSSTRTLYIWIVESSIPMAIILLSWGWNARKVAAGGGGMKVVITCQAFYKLVSKVSLKTGKSAFKSGRLNQAVSNGKAGTMYLECHHVEQRNLPPRCWHNIWVILWQSNTRICFFWVTIISFIGHENSICWLPQLRDNRCSGLKRKKWPLGDTGTINRFTLKHTKTLTLPDGFRSVRCHFHSLCMALDARANTARPEFVYNNRTICRSKEHQHAC